MSSLRFYLKRSGLPVLLVLCLAALSVSYASADEANRPRALVILGDPDAAVTGRFAVGTGSVGSKALTVVGVIDFLGAGTVHNYFTQGGGNNLQINTNVDEANIVGDASRSQWKLVLGSSLDWFSIRRSPAGGTYNEDALFFIEGSTGRVGIATVDTGNGGAIPFTPQARLHVEEAWGHAIWAAATSSSGLTYGIYGRSDSTEGRGVFGYASATTGSGTGVYGWSESALGRGVEGRVSSPAGVNYGVLGQSVSTNGYGVAGFATASTGLTFGVYGSSNAPSGRGLAGWAAAITGTTFGVFGQSDSSDGRGVAGFTYSTAGTTYGVYGQSNSGSGNGVYGYAQSTSGGRGVYGRSNAPNGYGVYGWAAATTGGAFGAYGQSDSTSGTGVFGWASAASGSTYGVFGWSSSPSGYGVYYIGGLAGTGTKSAIVQTQDYGWRHLYAVESPRNWFEDFGQATLVAGGAVVPIEPIFAQTVNLADGYHVFLTPLGECALYVAEKSSSSFTVRALEGAGCEIAFDYRIIAPRLGYEDLRLEPAEDPEAVAAAAMAGVEEIE